MRAIAVSEFGAVPALMDLPRPLPGPGELLVKVIAAGLNPLDWKIVDGMLKDSVPHSFPLILGTDAAGVVEEVGEGVTEFGVGEQVFGQFAAIPRGLGSYADYAIATEGAAVARMPRGMIYTQAAAVPTASMTGFNAVDAARVDSGQTVLVIGATGGVGQAAVQFAAGRGAKVIATARADMDAEMRRLGAGETVDHTAGDLNERVLAVHGDGIDAVLDFAGDRAAVEHVAGLLRPGGTYLSSIWSVNVDAMAAKEIRGVNLDNEATPGLLGEIADLIDADGLTVRVHREVALEDAPAALEANREGGARGKTVVRV
ncbi:NADP-dependent oxidoreductase [Spirillospora sp. CA-294931]|uniref:NADP-dependent oxidoreductase n=1 Tax=Spirillospora sp. CA-294931 TaxID=3240042 RepID=UPI003D92B2CB